MDYRYIEQLIERYFRGETTLQEEKILREFFAQRDVPAHLQEWQGLFAAQHQLAQAHLTSEFDQRLMKMIESEQGESNEAQQPKVAARKMSIYQRVRPLFRAAAIVAIAIVVGTVVQHSDSSYSSQQANMSSEAVVTKSTTQHEILSAEAIEMPDTSQLKTQESLNIH